MQTVSRHQLLESLRATSMCGGGWGPLWRAYEESRTTGAFGSPVMSRNVGNQWACIRLPHRWQRCGCTWTAPPRTWTTQSSLWSASRKQCCPGRFLCSSKDCKYSLLKWRHYSWHSSMSLDLDGFLFIIIMITLLFFCLSRKRTQTWKCPISAPQMQAMNACTRLLSAMHFHTLWISDQAFRLDSQHLGEFMLLKIYHNILLPSPFGKWILPYP